MQSRRGRREPRALGLRLEASITGGLENNENFDRIAEWQSGRSPQPANLHYSYLLIDADTMVYEKLDQ